ncbi:MAG: protein-methionine-sulfoxide reductase heme-binding subunit MsrQ [Pseudomonadota bacterium]
MTAARASLNRYATVLPSWIVYPLGMAPGVLLFYQALTGGLGVDPMAALEHGLGEWALKFLLLGLCITPLLRFGRINMVKYRRAIGLVAFAYVAAHLTTYTVLDKQLFWNEIIADIWKRPYITVGMGAFLMLLPLALTSNGFSVRKLGAATWRNLHKLTYPAVILGAAHWVMLEKVWDPEALIYLGLATGLVGLRVIPKTRSPGRTANATA